MRQRKRDQGYRCGSHTERESSRKSQAFLGGIVRHISPLHLLLAWRNDQGRLALLRGTLDVEAAERLLKKDRRTEMAGGMVSVDLEIFGRPVCRCVINGGSEQLSGPPSCLYVFPPATALKHQRFRTAGSVQEDQDLGSVLSLSLSRSLSLSVLSLSLPLLSPPSLSLSFSLMI